MLYWVDIGQDVWTGCRLIDQLVKVQLEGTDLAASIAAPGRGQHVAKDRAAV